MVSILMFAIRHFRQDVGLASYWMKAIRISTPSMVVWPVRSVAATRWFRRQSVANTVHPRGLGLGESFGGRQCGVAASAGGSLCSSAIGVCSRRNRGVRFWVSDGGSLFLIADHLPWGGAAAQLAEAFGLLFSHGDATDAMCGAEPILVRAHQPHAPGSSHERGRTATETVTAVRSITGQAFRSVNRDTSALLVLAPRTVLLLPTAPWEFTDQTPRVPASEGMLQGAALSFGSGRIAAFGEAAISRRGLRPPAPADGHEYVNGFRESPVFAERYALACWSAPSTVGNERPTTGWSRRRETCCMRAAAQP